MKKYLSILLVSLPLSSWADVTCTGKINAVYKPDNQDTLSMRLDGTNRWIKMPSKSDEAMALMAFAADKTVTVRWDVPEITSCNDGWDHNTQLVGWWRIDK
jgi:hypothetical protein